MSGIYNIGHCVMSWWISNCEQGLGTCLFYRHSTRIYLMKEKLGGPIPTGLKRWPIKLIKHLADTTCIVRPVKRDCAVLSKDTPLDISI